MNLAHRWLCPAYWRNAVEMYIFPWVLDGLDKSDEYLDSLQNFLDENLARAISFGCIARHHLSSQGDWRWFPDRCDLLLGN
jgi:hypothetical protein